MRSGAIVLAAGFSRRYGGNKLDARLADGATVLGRTVERLTAATTNIVVVTRQPLIDAGLFRDLVSEATPVLACPDADQGLGHSLAHGAAHVRDWDACLICLADMPFITSRTYTRLLAALGPDQIVRPHYRGQPGNPVGFGRRFLDELRQCRGDTGARAVIDAHPDRLQAVDVDDPGILRDVDRPSDLETP